MGIFLNGPQFYHVVAINWNFYVRDIVWQRKCFVAPVQVSPTSLQQGFADRDSRSSGEIGLGPILNNPAGLLEEEINLLPSPFFGSHGWARAAGSGTEKGSCH